PRQRLLHALEHPPPRRAGRVEGPALDQRLQRALVRALRIDPLGEVPQRLERTPLLARRDNRPRRRVADVLDRVQPEPDRAADDLFRDLEVLLLVDAVMDDHVVGHEVVNPVDCDVVNALFAGGLDALDLLPNNPPRTSRRLRVQCVDRRRYAVEWDSAPTTRGR